MGHSQSTENTRPGDSTPEAVTRVQNNMDHKAPSVPSSTSQHSNATPSLEQECEAMATEQSHPLVTPPPGEETQSSSPSPPPGDPVLLNPDYVALKRFVEENQSTAAGDTLGEDKLIPLLSSVARVFAKFPAHPLALELALETLPHCGPSLPRQAPPILTEVQMNALEALSEFDFASNPSLITPALHFITILWTLYSSSLPASCNLKHLGRFAMAALDPEIGGGNGRAQEAIKCSGNFVSSLMRVLSDSQMKALEKEGVYKQLRMLMMRYDEMSPDDIKQIVIGVGTFAEVTACAMAFLEEGTYVGFIQSTLKYPTDKAIQGLVWQLFAVLCKSEKKFAEGLFETDLLGGVLTLLRSEGAVIRPPLKFLQMCCQVAPSTCISSCLTHSELIEHVLSMLRTTTAAMGAVKSDQREGEGGEGVEEEEEGSSSDAVLADCLCLCEFLALLCRSEPANVARILDYKLIPHLEDCARARPDIGLLQACIAIEGVVNCFPPSAALVLPGLDKALKGFMAQRALFSERDHHLFFKDMLCHKEVSLQPQLVRLMYITLQKLLKAFTPDAMAKIHTRDFLEFFSVCFLRDTVAYPGLIARIVFTTHYLVFEMRNKEPISLLKELSFHVTVANLMQGSLRADDIATIMGLLACLVGKYYEFLKDVRPFLEARVPDMLLDKALVFGRTGRSIQFCEDFGRVMLNLTADKELSMELYEGGYLRRLMELLEEKGLKDMRRSMIHAVGNIALGGQNIKQVLLDQQFYLKLLSILRLEGKTGDPFLISACCRVLHVLASGDWAKRRFVECGCIEVLLDVMRVRRDNTEVRWRPLGLLSSLGFMSVTNRRYVLTDEVLDVVASILRESKNGKVISYTTLVFLGIDELDQGARRLRELGVGRHLQEAIDKPEYRKQAPDLERWGIHVLEKQNLYTVSAPSGSDSDLRPPLPPNHPSDWPPYVPLDNSIGSGSGSSDVSNNPGGVAVVRKLLPLDDASFRSYTPLAPPLAPPLATRLGQLGLDPDKPLFRIGRMYGSTHGLCSNCDKESASEELVIRPLSMTVHQYQQLIDNGWYRRGGVKMFRLRQNHNMECCDWETRVLVHQFDHTLHKSYKKVLRRMPTERLEVETVRAGFNRDSFDLYNQYHIKKHDKPLKSEHSYCEHVANTPTSYQQVEGEVECGTYHQLYRLDGKLVAIGIIDIIPKGIVSIYMWYSVDKEICKYSFGVYSALKEIELVKELSRKNPEMRYYYLQGWNGNNKKLSYKANYEPEEFYCPCIVPSWVSSLDGVAQAKARVLAEREEAAAVAATATKEGEGEGTEKMMVDGPEGESSNGKRASLTKSESKEESSGGDDKPSPPVHVECQAFPVDKLRYRQETGESEVDISRMVICLNYSHYMYLEDLFQRYELDVGQRDTVERRFKELVVALSPELRSQLVVDMMASQSSQT